MCFDRSAPPGRGRLAPAADALTGPFAQKWRLADQTRPRLGIGVPLGSRLLVSSSIALPFSPGPPLRGPLGIGRSPRPTSAQSRLDGFSLFARRRAEFHSDCNRPSVVPLTETGKAIRKLFQRRAFGQNERKRAVFEHSCHAALPRAVFMGLVHGVPWIGGEGGLAPTSKAFPTA